MKRIMFLICLCSIGIIASAQSSATGKPPVRTSDKAISQTVTKPVIPIRTGGGNGSGGRITPAVIPTRTGRAANNRTDNAKAQQDKALQLRAAAQKNGKTGQLTSDQPVRQSAVPVPATPQVH